MEVLKSIILMIMLLNPFLLIVYLFEIIQKMTPREFLNVLVKGGIISVIVFIIFSILGEPIFSYIFQAKFASLQIFGGVIFLLIGIQFVFKGTSAIEGLRGEPKNIAASIAMPIMIGPGTISASMIIGKQLPILYAALVITLSVFISIFIMYILKITHDYIKPRKAYLIEQYVEIAGRLAAIVIGIFSIEMILRGISGWFDVF